MVSSPPDLDLKQTILMDGSFGPQETERLAAVLSADCVRGWQRNWFGRASSRRIFVVGRWTNRAIAVRRLLLQTMVMQRWKRNRNTRRFGTRLR